MQFQAIASKANKKLTISLVASSIEEARSILHGQWYSIMELRETDANAPANIGDSKKNFFYFDILVNGQIKTWKIQSDDVFKSYKKLIEDLWYDVVYIYTNEWMNEAQKKTITAKVRDSYIMYKKSVWEEIAEKEERYVDTDIQQISPAILKQIEQYAMIIDSTIEKIQNLILKYHNTISLDKKMELEEAEHVLLQAKSSSNLWKIKMSVESTLKNIWEIELELVKTGKEDEKKKFLEETNALLKQIGSSDRIDTKTSQDIWKTVSDMFSRFKKNQNIEKKESKKVDTNSFIYFKNQRELNTYKQIAELNDRTILVSILTFRWNNLKRLFLKRRLLKQNIQIIDNRIHNRNISYTKIVHGVEYYKEAFISWLAYLSRIGAYVFFLYIISIMLLNIFSHFGIIDFMYQSNKSIFYITLFSVFVTILSYIRIFFLFFPALILFIFLLQFLSVNF